MNDLIWSPVIEDVSPTEPMTDGDRNDLPGETMDLTGETRDLESTAADLLLGDAVGMDVLCECDVSPKCHGSFMSPTNKPKGITRRGIKIMNK